MLYYFSTIRMVLITAGRMGLYILKAHLLSKGSLGMVENLTTKVIPSSKTEVKD